MWALWITDENIRSVYTQYHKLNTLIAWLYFEILYKVVNGAENLQKPKSVST